jgi:ABC-type molybdate transport system substrate-binding protein
MEEKLIAYYLILLKEYGNKPMAKEFAEFFKLDVSKIS